MKQPGATAPAVSVIIPAFESQATARATLESLRHQTFREFETILIDSGRTNEVAEIAADFPEVRYQRSPRQLLPHEARNVGAELATSDVLVFTDPDIVAAPDWLEKLVGAHRHVGSAIAGAVASLQRSWLETGVHLAKFDIWLPAQGNRLVPVAASVNFLCSRELLRRAGGFDGTEMIGDTVLSWDLTDLGEDLPCIGNAIVYHDHRSTFSQLLHERFVRGADFGRLRSDRETWTVGRTMNVILVSVVPLRLLKLTLRSLTNSLRAGCIFDGLRTLPIIVAGHAAWLAGEISQYCKRLHVRWAAPEAKEACM
ncbi:MAG: glycosyltransferase [Chthoniobacterales bacterium]